jgi:tellurite resistance protein TerC
VLVWFSLAAVFCLGVYLFMPQGEQRALEFAGGYVIKLSLSVDNLVLFIVIFKSFGLDSRRHRRVLNLGEPNFVL